MCSFYQARHILIISNFVLCDTNILNDNILFAAHNTY